MSDTPAAEYLKQVTAAAHRETEVAANSKMIMEGRIGPTEYQKLIQANYWVWAAIEHHLRHAAVDDPVWAPYLLGFSEQLQADLTASAAVPHARTESIQGMNWSDDATVLGALYVLNGSTLGGKYLYRAFKRNEHLSELEDFYFYRACSEIGPEHWPRFKQLLNEQLRDRTSLQRAEAAALLVFSKFTQAYRASFH